MSDVIKFNTEDSVTQGLKVVKEEPKLFNLVAQDNPILREVLPEFNFDNPPVNPNQFASTLVETCKQHNGIGLSANQCGFKHRVFVMGANDDYVAFFNPRLIEAVGEVHMLEGCLSFPLLGLRITRAKEIVVGYQDFNGKQHVAKFNGISARCFLHELDHMNGVLYTDVVKPLALQSGLKKLNKTVKKVTRLNQLRTLGKK